MFTFHRVGRMKNRYMRLLASFFAVVIVLISGTFVAAQEQPYSEADLVRYAKLVDVSKLDSTLPSQPLEEWLLHGPARIDGLYWRISLDCDLKDDEPDVEKDWPLCVKIGFRRGVISGFGVLRVGTHKSGISGEPVFQYLSVLQPLSVGGYDRLSEFPRYLDGIPQFGTLCVLPIPSEQKSNNSSPSTYSHHKRLRLRIDNGQELAWPDTQPTRIESLSLSWEKKHVLVVTSNKKQIQTLRFNFLLDYSDAKLCLGFDDTQLARLGRNERDSWCHCH